MAGQRRVVGRCVVGARREPARLAVAGLAGDRAGADRVAFVFGRAEVVEPSGLLVGDLLDLRRHLGAPSPEPATLAPAGLLVGVVGPFGTARCHGSSFPAESPLSSASPALPVGGVVGAMLADDCDASGPGAPPAARSGLSSEAGAAAGAGRGGGVRPRTIRRSLGTRSLTALSAPCSVGW